MSDLISRLSLKDRVSEYALSSDEYERFCKIIDAEPTAYDIDNVVVELNELDVKAIKRYKNGNFGDYEGTDYYIKKSKAIEIVKQGGVADDVCEWKAIGANDNWSTSCDKNSTHNVFGVAWFKRCPYCGRKLKIVGDNDDN